MKNITTERTRPMASVINIAETRGYRKNIELPIKKDAKLNLWYTLLDVKEWLYDTYSVYTWVSVNNDFIFTPHYRDLTLAESERVACRKCTCPKEALMTALTMGIKQIRR